MFGPLQPVDNERFKQAFAGQSLTLICRLREAAGSTSQFFGWGNADLLREAATEIEALKRHVHDLEEQKSPERQRAIGYAEAQRDIRRALGIEE